MKNLFDKTNIKNLEMKNRFIRSATWMDMAEEDGHLNEEIINMYEEVAKGGVGLIITGYTFISDDEQPNPRMTGIYDDTFIEEYKVLVDRVHRHGSKIALQIVLGGSQCMHPDADKMNIYGPSAVKNRVTGITPREVSKKDIADIVKKFGDAAYRAKESGFDSVQIHAAHGYFLSHFLTPYYNRRQDEYGGADIHNRSRIIYETIEEIKRRVGNDYPLMIKLNFDDFMDEGEGLSQEESIEIYKRVSELGVDIIEVSAINGSSGKGLKPSIAGANPIEKQSYFREAAANIALYVKSKVVLMGGNKDFNLMNELLNTTEIEYFSMSRALHCEPDLVNKWMGDNNYKAKCISCDRCWETQPNSCFFNR
jgi:2,4-dienoyl-CoA reductase-like NADH-dependent reductase (Old Yellow Enzyme family)